MFSQEKNYKNLLNLLKTLSVIFISALIAVSVFSGCTKSKKENPDKLTPTTVEKPAGELTGEKDIMIPDSPQEIIFWDSCEPGDRIFLMNNIESFKKENPGIDIKVKHFRNEEELMDTFSAASLAGAGPDLMLIGLGNTKRLAKENVLKDLTGEFRYNLFVPGLNELTFANGRNFAVPFNSSDFLLFFYNKDLISQVPSDFDEVMAYSREKTDAAAKTYGFLLNARQPEWIIPFTGGFLDWIYDYESGSISLNNNAVIKTLDFLNELYNTDNTIPFNVDYEEINNSFKAGETAMIINGSWAIDEYKNENLNFGVSKIPRLAEALSSPTPMVSGLGFMVNINISTDSFENSKNFINYMLSKTIQKAWMLNTASFPAITGLEKEDVFTDDILYNALLQLKICRGALPETDMRLVREVVKANIEKLIMGDISVEDAADKMQEDIIKMKSGQLKIENYARAAQEDN